MSELSRRPWKERNSGRKSDLGGSDILGAMLRLTFILHGAQSDGFELKCKAPVALPLKNMISNKGTSQCNHLEFDLVLHIYWPGILGLDVYV